MAQIKRLKSIIKSSPLGWYLTERYKRQKYQYFARKYNDPEFICRLYLRANGGRSPDLEHPRLFTEKLQWLKLYYRDERIPLCSEKAEAKKYIAQQGYADLLIPTIAVYDRAQDVDLAQLPERFILKATHGSGWNILCTDRSALDWKRVRKIMQTWLDENLYIFGREWNYRELTPRILAEELIGSGHLVDYKFMCFNGVVRAMQVNHEINGEKYVDLYDADWNLLADMGTGVAPHSAAALPKPPDFEKMKEIAAQLAKPFPFVRVDLYHEAGKIYFGEMTFFPGSGFWSISPAARDAQFGEWLTLPEPNHFI